MKFDLFVKENETKKSQKINSFECETSNDAFEIAEEFIYDTLMSLYDEETNGEEFDEFDFLAFMEDNEIDYFLRSDNLLFKNFKTNSKDNPLRKLVFSV